MVPRSADETFPQENCEYFLLKHLPYRFLLAAVIVLVGAGVDLPWLEFNPVGILAVRFVMITGCLMAYRLSRFCRTCASAEALIIFSALGSVSGMGLLGWMEGTYLTGQTAAVYQVLAFITIFLPLRPKTFVGLYLVIGVIWFALFPITLPMQLQLRLFFSHLVGYLTYGYMSFEGSRLYFRTREDQAKYHRLVENRSEQLQELAIRDGLTGLYNFRHFQHSISMFVDQKKPFSLCLVDLDNLKLINDEEGHLMGNIVLQHLASCLTSVVRKSDLVFRIGGDEFALILPETSAETARIVMERFQTILSLGLQGHENRTSLTRPLHCSIGIAELSPELNSPTLITQAADRALYKAKSNEGNQIRVCPLSPE